MLARIIKILGILITALVIIVTVMRYWEYS